MVCIYDICVMKRQNTDIQNLILIHVLILGSVLFLTKGMFGSDLDWLNQHVVLADEIRTTILKCHTLFPDYVKTLMSGSNFYNFSYYGYLRPDVLVSCLFPSVPMAFFIEFYAIFSLCLLGTCSYLFFRKVQFSSSASTVLSLVSVFCSVFFHLHSQLMFVNYMPFLFLGLYAVETMKENGKIGLLVFAESLIMVHSYYYSVSAYIAILIWFLLRVHKEQKKNFARLFLSFVITFLLTAVLTIPTIWVLLSNHKDVVKSSFVKMFIPSFHLKGLLYATYGIGFGYLSWILLCMGLLQKENWKMSVLLIVSFVFPLVSWILSGTLYARSKMLIALLPLVLYQCGCVMKKGIENRFHRWWNLIPLYLLPCVILDRKFIWVDLAVSVLILVLSRKKAWLLIPVASMYLTFEVNTPETFLSQETYDHVYSSSLQTLLKRNASGIDRLAIFSNKQIVNQTFQDTVNRASGYTSTYNSLYNSFLYDTLHLNMASNNRVKENDENNFFYLSMLSCNSVISKTYVPLSYEAKDSEKGMNLYQSSATMPVAYATSDLYSESDFEKLAFPYSLDVLYNHAIVSGKTRNKDTSAFIEEHPMVTLDGNEISGTQMISLKKQAVLDLNLKRNTKNRILVLTFKVKNRKPKKAVDITINGQHNHRSPSDAVYYNHNETFTYTLSSNEGINSLHVVLGKGDYELSDFAFYSLDENTVLNRNREVDAFKSEESTLPLKGSIHVSKDGYFVTTLPYDRGYSVYLDGKEISYEKVNTTFVGFPITKGKHRIEIDYHAPMKKLALCMSMSGIILYGLLLLKERKSL